MKMHDRHNAPVTQATVSVTPNPATLQAEIKIDGAGFRPNIVLTLAVSLTEGPSGQGGGPQIGGVRTDAGGTFSAPWTASWIGTETVLVIDEAVIVGSCTFETEG